MSATKMLKDKEYSTGTGITIGQKQRRNTRNKIVTTYTVGKYEFKKMQIQKMIHNFENLIDREHGQP